MTTFKKSMEFDAPADVVFDRLDDLGVTGMHMTKSSIPMMGGKMDLQFLSSQKRGLNTRYRWTGKVMWMPIDFVVEVTKWVPGKEKSWETVGPAKLIIYSWFKMNLKASPRQGNSSKALLTITYEKPRQVLPRFLCFLLGDWYAKWCINNMLDDTRKIITKPVHT